MNFQTVLEELDRLYEEELVKADEEAVEEQKNEQPLTEAAEEDVEEVAEEATEEEPEEEVEEEPAEEDVDEAAPLVLECANCGAIIIKTVADVVVDDESGRVNMEEPCQYCEAANGHKIIGMLAPYDEAEDEEVEIVDDEEVVEEGLFGGNVGIDMPINIKADGNTVSVGTLGG